MKRKLVINSIFFLCFFFVLLFGNYDLKAEENSGLINFEKVNLLFVSDRPEAVTQDGILFQECFENGTIVRLLFNHINLSSQTRKIRIFLKNEDSNPASIAIVSGCGGPDKRSIKVGHDAAKNFLIARRDGKAEIKNIQPFTEVLIYDMAIAPHELVSGFYQFHILNGKKLKVTVLNSVKNAKPDELKILDAPFNPFCIHPRGVFEPADIIVEEKHSTGETKEIFIADGPWLIDKISGEPNTGNYGSVYEIFIHLFNSTSDKNTVYIYFEPVNGLARGSFVIEKELLQTLTVKPPHRFLLATVELGAREKRTFQITTLPQAGCWYPVKLVVTNQALESENQEETTEEVENEPIEQEVEP